MTIHSRSRADHTESSVRALVLSGMIIWRRDEASEVWEQVSGMVEADDSGAVDLTVSDGRTVFKPEMFSEGMNLRPIGSLIGALARGVDVLHVHHVLPPIRHLIIAALFRLRGSRIVLSPHGFLTDDFANTSWTHSRPRVWTVSKPLVLRILRLVWGSLAHSFVCLSQHEVTSSHLPDMRCALLPFPKPDSPLLRRDPPLLDSSSDRRSAPILFISRMDPWRKGIDRLCTWLSEYPSAGPRPAVVLLAPRDARTPPAVSDLNRLGLLKWDWQTRGSDLEIHLQNCRGVMLLSRYEGQPRSLREALWMGLPIICPATCNLSEAIAVLGAGKVVSGDDAAELQAAFESLVSDEWVPRQARRLFDRRGIGRFLISLILDVGSGRQPSERDYYSSFLQSGHALSA